MRLFREGFAECLEPFAHSGILVCKSLVRQFDTPGLARYLTAHL
jgi:hypothetical protein